MKLRNLSLVLLFLFLKEGTSSFHGSLTNIVLSNSNYSGRTIVENQVYILVQPNQEQYFIFIHDDERNSFFDLKEWYERLRNVLLSKYPNSTIFETHWQWKGNMFMSTSAADIKEFATDYLYFFNLLTDKGVSPKKIIVIAHGFGALIGSETAKLFEKIHGVKVGRIVALDPAEIKATFSQNLYVSKNDAAVVMAIHTVRVPQKIPAGSIEFFPNGGKYHPGCSIWSLINVCTRRLSYEYFISAVSYPDNFIAYKCESYNRFKQGKCTDDPVSMGDLESTKPGKFFLETTARAPYFSN